jgi:hypothetical protein
MAGRILLLISLLLVLSHTAHGQHNYIAARKLKRLDIPALKLTAGLVTSEVYDGMTTMRTMNNCRRCYEADPAAKVLIGERPTWGRMIFFGTLETAGAYAVAAHMRNSNHKWERRLWWTVPAGLIVMHAVEGSHNFVVPLDTKR